MNLLGGVEVAVRPDAIESPGCVPDQLGIEAIFPAMRVVVSTQWLVVARRSRSIGYLFAGRRSSRSVPMKALLTCLTMMGSPGCSRPALDGKTGAIDCKAGVGRPAGVPNMKDRHLVVAERVQQADDVSEGVRVVALSAGSFPFIECNLDIDDNKAGGSLGSWFTA